MSLPVSYMDCPNESLDLFSKPAVQSDVLYFKEVEYFPQTAALNASKQTVVFDIAAQSDHMIDLNHSYFITSLSLKKSDGSNIGKTETENIGVINNIGQSLWKQIELVLNDTPVTESNAMYAYQSFMETVLTYDETRAKNYLMLTNFVADEPGKESKAHPTNVDAQKNSGLNARSKPFDDGTIVKVMTKPHINICNQGKYLPPGVRIQWRLSPGSYAFCLMGKADSTNQLYIHEVKLVIRHIHVKDTVLKGIDRTLMKTPATYPFCQPHMATYLIPSGTTSWIQDNIFNGKIPNRLFFGLVENSAYNGALIKNPFNFEHQRVSNVQVTVDNQEISPPLRLGYATQDYLDAYNRLTSTLGNYPSLIRYNSFDQGLTIYGFDLTPKGNCDDEQYLMKREGNLRININFGIAPTELLNIVILGEFDRVIQIDAHKNVIRDW